MDVVALPLPVVVVVVPPPSSPPKVLLVPEVLFVPEPPNPELEVALPPLEVPLLLPVATAAPVVVV